MTAIRATIQRLLFAAYVIVFITLPFAMLLGTTGLAIGASLAVLCLVALRYHGTRRVAKQLGVELVAGAQAPHWKGVVREYSRRLKIGVPRLGVMQSDSVNLATFGFSSGQGWIVVTSGAFEKLNRNELAALMARELILWKKSEVPGHTWLALFLHSLDVWVGPRKDSLKARMRTSHPVRLFLRQVFFYPLTLLPCSLLRGNSTQSALDEATVALCGSRRSLTEGLRKIDAYSERRVLRTSLCFHHLFLKSPESPDPLARLFFSTSTLAERIRFLEQLPATENA